jgi:hypothetical protein
MGRFLLSPCKFLWSARDSSPLSFFSSSFLCPVVFFHPGERKRRKESDDKSYALQGYYHSGTTVIGGYTPKQHG